MKKEFSWLDKDIHSRPELNHDKTYGDWHAACRRVTVCTVLKDKKHNGTPVYFYSTHYDHRSLTAIGNSSDLMVEQMRAIGKSDDIKNAKGVVIVVGDLNTTSESGHLAPLEKNMYYARFDAPGLDRYTGTFNGFGHSCSLIDHIFYGGKAVSPVKYWVDRTDYGVPFLSDHYPVLFEFDYK